MTTFTVTVTVPKRDLDTGEPIKGERVEDVMNVEADSRAAAERLVLASFADAKLTSADESAVVTFNEVAQAGE